MKRVKHAIGDKSFTDSTFDILALNTAAPQGGNILTPFEAMHRFVSPVSGIPISDTNKKWLVSRKWLTEKKNKKEQPGFLKEKIHYALTERLSSGDRIYYRDRTAGGSRRRKAGIIIQRKYVVSI